MDEKKLLASLLDILEMGHRISMEIENISGEAETLSMLVHNLFMEINPIKDITDELDSWTNYIKETKKYLKQGSK